jgi:NO-binding membrane sensor protein with MHYT domain
LIILYTMEYLQTSHSAFLTSMAGIVALAAGFTGLSLTRGLQQRAVMAKKLSVALAAVALGGGIWAMHFIAMLGLQMPVLFYYDAAVTLISALTAILIVGAALMLLHFAERTPLVITCAGAIVGGGVLAMHYIGMAGLQLCRAVYTWPGLVISSVVAIGLCIMAFWVAYGHRTNRNILLGTLFFAFAVIAVHFLAMAGTRFVAMPDTGEFGPLMSNETLALGVIFFSFVIFGACLWVSVTYLLPAEGPTRQPAAAKDAAEPAPTEQVPDDTHVLCERDGSKVYLSAKDILFVRADAHYTQVYTAQERLFCTWSISEAAKCLLPAGFLQTHRSYLVNPGRVARFERVKDKGRCVFEGDDIPPALVSRTKLKTTQDALAP